VFGSDSVKLGRQRCKVETVETVEEFRRQRARFWCGLREQFDFRLNPPDMPDAEQFAEPAQMVERGNRQGRRLQREEGPAYGAGNRFGFPAPDVMARWRASGATLLRTDEGAVRFLADGVGVRRVPARSAIDALALAKEVL